MYRLQEVPEGGLPAVCMKDGKSTIDPTLCVGCTVCAQVCPKGAIERKE